MSNTTVNAAEYCYGSPVTSGDWSGISLSYLLQQAGIEPTVASINLYALDGYGIVIPAKEAMLPDVIIAYKLNGEPVPETLPVGNS